jgi:uncharacterized membrane protein YfcA
MPYTSLAIIIGCAVLYYRIGEQEYDSGVILALVSVTLWLVGSFAFGFGWLSNLSVQAGLFFGLTFWNMWRRGGRLH